MGPRITAGASPSKKPKDINFSPSTPLRASPWASTGTIIRNSLERTLTPEVRLNSVGRDGPWMSASKSPVLKPCWHKERANPAATVDFPTPPLQEETAITCLTLVRPNEFFISKPQPPNVRLYRGQPS